MNKGAVYSKIFRKAGLAWGKGDLNKAIALLQEGIALAAEHGDVDVSRLLQADLERYQGLARGESCTLSHRLDPSG